MDYRINGLTAILILIMWTQQVYVIGYNCGSASTNLTSSLINVEECDVAPPSINSSKVCTLFLQVNFKVIQCKVEIDRLIRKYGIFSHIMNIYNGKYMYTDEVSRQACQYILIYGNYEFASIHIIELKFNQPTTRPVILTDHVNIDRTYFEGTYSDSYGTRTHTDIIVLDTIILQDYADIRLNTNHIQFRSGVICEFSAIHCTDTKSKDIFWNFVSADSCRFSEYSTLYWGYADKIMNSINELSQVASSSLTTQDTIFALTSISKLTCGCRLIRTERSKLIIFETSSGIAILKYSIRITNLDIFIYVNSKFVCVEKYTRIQINFELQLLQNSLAIVTRSLDIFAYYFMRESEYMALLAEEIHIVKYVSVEVKLAQTQKCYDQLSILQQNQIYFLTSQMHILQGTQITCDSFVLFIMYQLGDVSYKFIPRPVETLAPTIMKPLIKLSWRYIIPRILATNGIYMQDDLEELKDHMFPAKQLIVLNTVARGIVDVRLFYMKSRSPILSTKLQSKKFPTEILE